MLSPAMFRSPLLQKIVKIILLVALGGIALSGIVINIALERQFRDYLDRVETARRQQVLRGLAEFYLQEGGWPRVPAQIGLRRGMFFANLRYVTDRNGQIVLFTRSVINNETNSTPVPIIINGRRVGNAHFGTSPNQQVLSRIDQGFRITINRSIFGSILLTGLIALVIAALFAKKISTPITAMNGIAKNMTEGNLSSRIADLPRDELGELGASLNKLAGRLQQMNELRRKMTADVAHELRTPVATVKSHLEGMIDEVIPPSKQNLLSLLEETDRLTSLIDQLQEIATAEANVRHIHKEPLELAAFLAEAVHKHTALFQEKNLTLTLTLQAAPGTVITDGAAVSRIMDNLLTNAYKYTPSGKTVAVILSDQGDSVTITVRDQGIGIAAADLPFVFERFYRADPSRNRESGGFGLGLTIVKELVEALGGRITVSSQLNQGSEFAVRLPKK